MATSGSINFSVTRDDIIQEALEQIGAIGIGETPTTGDITSCSRTLNMMIKAWQGQGIHLWTQTDMSVPVVASQATYSLSPRPLHIRFAQLRNSDSVDRPIRIDSRSDFKQIANKTATGPITRVYYDPQLNSGTLSVWPLSDNATDTLQLTYLRSFEDFDTGIDNPDLPQEWFLTLALNLGVLVAPKYGKPLSKLDPDFLMSARSSLIDMQLWDTEAAKISVVPARDDYNA